MCTAATSSFAGLAVTRWFLGMTEASINPGFITITAMWYTRHEQASRSALWITMICVFTIFGSVLTYGLGSIQGSLSTWKWIYLVLGALTILWGALWLYCVPDNPATASWLTENQRITALQRLLANQTGTKSRRFVKSQMIEALLDIKVWIIALTVMANTLVGGALTFQSIIMADLGFDNLQVALLNMPYGALGTMFALAAALVIHYIPNSRLFTSAASMLPAIAGTLMIKLLPNDLAHAWTRMVGVWLLASWNNGFFIMLGLIGPNIAGSTKRTTANTIIFVFYCLGPIIGTQLFPDSESPRYPTGLAVMLGAFCVHAALNVLLRFVYMMENARRDRELVGVGVEELEEMRAEGVRNGFEDVTDGQNRMFRYVM
jgi:MFS family permease